MLPIILIAIVGKTKSGKQTTVDFLQEFLKGRKVVHISSSEILQNILKSGGLTPTRENMQDLVRELVSLHGPDALTRLMKEEVEKHTGCIVIYDCIRLQSDLEYIKSVKPHFIIYVSADADVRFDRATRLSEKPCEIGISREEFDRLEQKPTELSIERIGESHGYKIENNGTRDEFGKKVYRYVSVMIMPELRRIQKNRHMRQR